MYSVLGSILDTGRETISHNPLLFIGLSSVCYWFLLTKYTGQTSKLKHIAAAGSEMPVLSLLQAGAFLANGRKIITETFKKWDKSAFKFPDITEWIVVVSDPQSIDELRKAPENVLSSMIAFDQSLQVKYTMGERVSKNPYHIPIVRAQLTRALPQLVPEVQDELEDAFKQFIPPTDDWTSVKVVDTIMKVVGRASNRVFVGLPLCRDPDYIKLNVQFAVDVIQCGTILRIMPSFLRPLVNLLISNVSKRTDDAMKYLVPIFQARREERANSPQAPRSPDILNWLMDEAKEDELTDSALTTRLLTVNFAAIHTSSMAFSHALYHLAASPEYLKPLREEVEEVVSEEGWTKAALDKMVKIDSFLKETQRLHPLSSVMMNRVAVNDYHFSNGLFVPQGTTVAVAILPAHLNGDLYEDPKKFDPFRFVKMKQHEETEAAAKRFDMTSTNCESLGFGHGRHACPGRYFAVSELKLMLAYVVTHYDVRCKEEGVRPEDMWIGMTCVPNPKGEVLFRKRQA
ncbi:cytochrome P450 [Pholiota conissans]|uniref:Cytochrome P450 n=1 Tax=Pholiota conissans TaxID=109636 RepID=A0A9P5YZY6_9AGAR|nr:cytochrome P450 [Pholiota conissans]